MIVTEFNMTAWYHFKCTTTEKILSKNRIYKKWKILGVQISLRHCMPDCFRITYFLF